MTLAIPAVIFILIYLAQQIAVAKPLYSRRLLSLALQPSNSSYERCGNRGDISFGAVCYRFVKSTEPVSYEVASNYCRNLAGNKTLAVVHSKIHQLFLANYLESRGWRDALIGLRLIETPWKWVQPFDYNKTTILEPYGAQLLPGQGCYGNSKIDTHNSKYSNRLTVQGCVEFCRKKGKLFGGVQAGTLCLCTNRLPLASRAATNCTMACSGDNNQLCGNHRSIYFYNAQLPDLRNLFTGDNWAAKRPARSGSCVASMIVQNRHSAWADFDCSTKMPFVCQFERALGSEFTELQVGTLAVAAREHAFCTARFCYVMFPHVLLDFSTANKFCSKRGHGGRLARISTAQDQIIVNRLFISINREESSRKYPLRFWIGAKNVEFRWSNGRPLRPGYAAWSEDKEPYYEKSQPKCVRMSSFEGAYKWKLRSCDDIPGSTTFICSGLALESYLKKIRMASLMTTTTRKPVVATPKRDKTPIKYKIWHHKLVPNRFNISDSEPRTVSSSNVEAETSFPTARWIPWTTLWTTTESVTTTPETTTRKRPETTTTHVTLPSTTAEAEPVTTTNRVTTTEAMETTTPFVRTTRPEHFIRKLDEMIMIVTGSDEYKFSKAPTTATEKYWQTWRQKGEGSEFPDGQIWLLESTQVPRTNFITTSEANELSTRQIDKVTTASTTPMVTTTTSEAPETSADTTTIWRKQTTKSIKKKISSISRYLQVVNETSTPRVYRGPLNDRVTTEPTALESRSYRWITTPLPSVTTMVAFVESFLFLNDAEAETTTMPPPPVVAKPFRHRKRGPPFKLRLRWEPTTSRRMTTTAEQETTTEVSTTTQPEVTTTPEETTLPTTVVTTTGPQTTESKTAATTTLEPTTTSAEEDTTSSKLMTTTKPLAETTESTSKMTIRYEDTTTDTSGSITETTFINVKAQEVILKHADDVVQSFGDMPDVTTSRPQNSPPLAFLPELEENEDGDLISVGPSDETVHLTTAVKKGGGLEFDEMANFDYADGDSLTDDSEELIEWWHILLVCVILISLISLSVAVAYYHFDSIRECCHKTKNQVRRLSPSSTIRPTSNATSNDFDGDSHSRELLRLENTRLAKSMVQSCFGPKVANSPKKHTSEMMIDDSSVEGDQTNHQSPAMSSNRHWTHSSRVAPSYEGDRLPTVTPANSTNQLKSTSPPISEQQSKSSPDYLIPSHPAIYSNVTIKEDDGQICEVPIRQVALTRCEQHSSTRLKPSPDAIEVRESLDAIKEQPSPPLSAQEPARIEPANHFFMQVLSTNEQQVPPQRTINHNLSILPPLRQRTHMIGSEFFGDSSRPTSSKSEKGDTNCGPLSRRDKTRVVFSTTSASLPIVTTAPDSSEDSKVTKTSIDSNQANSSQSDISQSSNKSNRSRRKKSRKKLTSTCSYENLNEIGRDHLPDRNSAINLSNSKLNSSSPKTSADRNGEMFSVADATISSQIHD